MSHRPPSVDMPDTADLTVTFGEGSLPFSKGVLAQSLLATAMEPIEAFEIARSIERELLGNDVRTISRTELRARTAKALERETGADSANRYLLWRRHQEPDRPVALLLGGTSGVGKSALAVEVARRLGIHRVLSTDSIRQIMRIMTSPRLVPALYGSSYDAWRHLPSESDRVPSVIEGFRAQAAAVSVGICASIDRTIAETANLVVDGVSIVPGGIDLESYSSTADIVTLVVATLDEDSLRRRFIARAGGQKMRLADRYLQNFESILEIQRHLIDQARRHDVTIIDNVTFESSVREVIEAATSMLRAKEAAQVDGARSAPP